MNRGANLEQARKLVEAAVRQRIGDSGIRVDVTSGRDHDGDEALFVDVFYDLTDKPVDPRALYGLTTEVRRELESIGETRFPYVRNRFDERQKVAV